jgi:hypothetical protein
VRFVCAMLPRAARSCSKAALVRGLWRDHRQQPAVVRLIAHIMLDFHVNDANLWLAVLRALVTFGRHRDLLALLAVLCEPEWQHMLRFDAAFAAVFEQVRWPSEACAPSGWRERCNRNVARVRARYLVLFVVVGVVWWVGLVCVWGGGGWWWWEGASVAARLLRHVLSVGVNALCPAPLPSPKVLQRPLLEYATMQAGPGGCLPPSGDVLAVFDTVVSIAQRCPVIQLMDLSRLVVVRGVGARAVWGHCRAHPPPPCAHMRARTRTYPPPCHLACGFTGLP